ncbi:alpha/beta hydrolase [Streptomyces sp. NBC_00576]|uniref:alpha/beta hydrolase n=1 Tax=Streptomyces sp. NBC_00576 TaxID=2903665 RepID=UPI002E807B0E|nr:alpha/beta hydrolase [Streptomyces sp. NBC_00576]WUB76644.1 alpha/beta hydrolase [Streptomyces sp. NBC_00576]
MRCGHLKILTQGAERLHELIGGHGVAVTGGAGPLLRLVSVPAAFVPGWLGSISSPEISIANADLTGLPPRIVYYGEYETLSDDGAQLGRRLADFKVTSEVHSMPEGQHSFVLGAGRVPEVDQAIGQMGQWLRKHLGA